MSNKFENVLYIHKYVQIISSIAKFLQPTNNYHQYPPEWTVSWYFTAKVIVTQDTNGGPPGPNKVQATINICSTESVLRGSKASIDTSWT